MAKLHNTRYATFDPQVWGAKREVRVGHNRKLHFIPATDGADPELHFTLHGSPVAKLVQHENGQTLVLDHHGYMTSTTASAMRDALGLFGLDGGVSFARNKITGEQGFNARLFLPAQEAGIKEWVEFNGTETGCIAPFIDGYPDR